VEVGHEVVGGYLSSVEHAGKPRYQPKISLCRFFPADIGAICMRALFSFDNIVDFSVYFGAHLRHSANTCAISGQLLLHVFVLIVRLSERV